MAYGQTGAGKTYTMTGSQDSYKHRGLIARAIAQLFKSIQERPQTAYVVRISHVEIHSESLTDLLANVETHGPQQSSQQPHQQQQNSQLQSQQSQLQSQSQSKAQSQTQPGTPSSNSAALVVVDDKDKSGVYIKGLNRPIVKNDQEALMYLFEGDMNRTISEHALNKSSTR